MEGAERHHLCWETLKTVEQLRPESPTGYMTSEGRGEPDSSTRSTTDLKGGALRKLVRATVLHPLDEIDLYRTAYPYLPGERPPVFHNPRLARSAGRRDSPCCRSRNPSSTASVSASRPNR